MIIIRVMTRVQAEGDLLFSLLELQETERITEGVKKEEEEIKAIEDEEEASAETTGEIAAKTEDISTGKQKEQQQT